MNLFFILFEIDNYFSFLFESFNEISQRAKFGHEYGYNGNINNRNNNVQGPYR